MSEFIVHYRDCPYCQRTAKDPYSLAICPVCQGNGRVEAYRDQRECRFCSGTGRDPYQLSPCRKCAGFGAIHGGPSIAIDGIATLFGSIMGKYSIHKLCSTLGYEISSLQGLNKTEIISKILHDSYQQDRAAFESFIVALISVHELGKQDLARVNSHLKELGYEMSAGALKQISPVHKTAELIRLAFPSLSDEAMAMAESFVVLYVLENALREFVRERLREKLGTRWWEDGVPERIKTSAEKTKLKEMGSPWHDVKAVDMLGYTTFEDIQGVIQSNWDIFDKYFHDQVGLVGRLKELEIPRNAIAHTRILEDSEVDRLRLFAHDVLKCIAPG